MLEVDVEMIEDKNVERASCCYTSKFCGISAPQKSECWSLNLESESAGQALAFSSSVLLLFLLLCSTRLARQMSESRLKILMLLPVY